MDALQRSWYELKFLQEFRFKSGNAFQDFFSDVMERRYPGDFQRIRPYGNLGDRKCDGYHTSIKLVYQLYAPETFNLAAILNKITGDFQGALAYWKGQMLGWRFVHNQWRGLPSDVVSALIAIEAKHKLQVTHWGEPEVRNEVFQLSDNELANLLGHAPSRENLNHLGMADLRPILESLASQNVPLDAVIQPVSEHKLEANGLSAQVRNFLLIGMQKSALVQRFFQKWHDPLLGDRIAKAFRARYDDLKSQDVVGDDAFLALWNFAAGPNRESPVREAAILAVIAFLFEQCDIFEPAPVVQA
jgi:hypothetical protein